MATFELDSNYFFVLALIAITCFHCFLQGFAVGGARRKYFNKDFFERNFPDLVKGDKFPTNGYPDMGAGYYSNKLSHDEWLAFNTTMRGHLNYLEALPLMIVYEAVAGLFYARFTLVVGLVFIVGRQLYSSGYRSASGPRGRGAGAGLSFLSMTACFGAAVYGAFVAAGGVPALMKLCSCT